MLYLLSYLKGDDSCGKERGSWAFEKVVFYFSVHLLVFKILMFFKYCSLKRGEGKENWKTA